MNASFGQRFKKRMNHWTRFICLVLGLATVPTSVISSGLVEHNPDCGKESNDSVQHHLLVMSEAIKRNEINIGELTQMIDLKDQKIEALQDNINVLEEILASVGKVRHTSDSSTMFLVESSFGGYWLPTGDIIFETVKVDNSGSFDKESGTFTAPSDGTFAFFFNCPFAGGPNVALYVYVNDMERQYFIEQYSGTHGSRVLSVFWSLDLKVNDKLKLSNHYENTLFGGYNQGAFFMGYKV